MRVKTIELSATDFSIIRFAWGPTIRTSGIGGNEKVIWYTDTAGDRITQLSTTDFSIIRYAASPGALPSGIGGDEKVIWHTDVGKDMIFEIAI